MNREKKTFKVVDFDKQGPEPDNHFLPSIVIQPENGGDRICVGLKYNGHSSLDPKSYVIDHANRWRGGSKSWEMSPSGLNNLLKGSNFDPDKLIEEYTRSIRKK